MNMINLWNIYFRDKIFVFKNSKDVNESRNRLIASHLQARTAAHYRGCVKSGYENQTCFVGQGGGATFTA